MARSKTGDRITETAARLFLVNGYAGLSMQEVRREAGLSNGSLYHRFPSKASLVGELLVEGMQQCQQLVIETLDAAPAPMDAVGGTVRRYVGWVERHRELAALLFADLPDEALLAAEPALAASNRDYVRTVRL